MTTFTFFLRDDTIHEIVASDKDEAMRLLCAKLRRSWAELHPEIVDCLSAE